MQDFKALDALYESAPIGHPEIPPGEYFLRVVGAEPTQSSIGTLGIRVRFRIEEGALAGQFVREDYWLTEAAVAVSKSFLHSAGFERFKLSEIPDVHDFRNFPLLKALLSTREYQGKKYSEIKKLSRVPPQVLPSDGSPAL